MDNKKFTALIDEVINQKISDVHLSSNLTPYIRNKIGDMVPVDNFGVISHEDILEICKLLSGKEFA